MAAPTPFVRSEGDEGRGGGGDYGTDPFMRSEGEGGSRRVPLLAVLAGTMGL